MKVIIIGGTGTIGSAVVKELSPRHDIVTVGRTKGDLSCDMTSEESIRSMFESAGDFNAVIIAAGNIHFAGLPNMTSAKYQEGLNHKLMGQVNIVLIGQKFIQDNGSFTLTSGILSHDPIKTGSSASMVNSATEGFVRAAAIELTRGIRINAVSPSIVTESLPKFGDYFHGYESVPASRVALAYSKSTEGLQTGQVYKVW